MIVETDFDFRLPSDRNFRLVKNLNNRNTNITIKTIVDQIPTRTPEPSPTLTPTPTPTPTNSPTPTLTPTPTPSASPVRTPTPSPTPSPTPTPTNSPTPTPTNSPTPTFSPTPTPSPTSSSTPTPTISPSPTPNRTPIPTPLPTSTPRPTPTPTTTPSITPTPTIPPPPTCPDRILVFQVCNSNSARDDNFEVYLNGSYIGFLDLNFNSQVGSVFIAGTQTLTQPDFVCPLTLMQTYRFDRSLVLFGTNTLELRNVQNNNNANFGTIGIRNYLISGNDLIEPCAIANLTYSGGSGESFTLSFEFTQCCPDCIEPWSEWTPSELSVCEGEEFTQSRSRCSIIETRTAIGTATPYTIDWYPPEYDICEGEVFTQYRETYCGSSIISTETRPATGTAIPYYYDWYPLESEICEGEEFTQYRDVYCGDSYYTETRQAIGTSEC